MTVSLAKVADPDGAPSRVVVSRNVLLMYPEKRSRTQNLPPQWLRQDDNLGWCEASKEVGPRSNFARTPRSACSLRSRVAPFASHTSAFAPFREPPPRAPSRRSPPRASDRSSAGRDRPHQSSRLLGRRSERPARNHGVRSRRAPAQNHQGASGRRARRARGPTHGLDPPSSDGCPSEHRCQIRIIHARLAGRTDVASEKKTTHASFSRFFTRRRAAPRARPLPPPFLPVRYRRSRAGDPALAFRARDRDLRAAAGG